MPIALDGGDTALVHYSLTRQLTKKSMSTSDSAPAALRDLHGWMVLGVINDGGAQKALSVPVLANSASAALTLAAEAHVDFQPVGVMSEDELLGHLRAIQHHRNAFSVKT